MHDITTEDNFQWYDMGMVHDAPGVHGITMVHDFIAMNNIMMACLFLILNKRNILAYFWHNEG